MGLSCLQKSITCPGDIVAAWPANIALLISTQYPNRNGLKRWRSEKVPPIYTKFKRAKKQASIEEKPARSDWQE
jgi:hypothetical protein